MGNEESTSSGSRTYSVMKSRYDAAHAAIRKAIAFEEQANIAMAVQEFKRAVQLIEEALAVHRGENSEICEEVEVMIRKMKKTRAELMARIYCIQHDVPFERTKLQPPYEQQMLLTDDASDKISGDIVAMASRLANGLVTGASIMENLIDFGVPMLMNHINTPNQTAEIPSDMSEGVNIAQSATQVTEYIAEQVGTAAVKLSTFLAPHIEKQGVEILTTNLGMSGEEASSKVKDVMTFAAGVAEGFGQSLKTNTIKVVQHKYGDRAGQFVEDSINTALNVVKSKCLAEHADGEVSNSNHGEQLQSTETVNKNNLPQKKKKNKKNKKKF